MRQTTKNTFDKGMQKDLNPLTTPPTILTDCLNGTIITYNGNEFTLQNDMGNCKVDQAMMQPGFIPMGMQEYGGIIYVVAYNPVTGEAQFGSFPSPQEDFSTTDFDQLSPVEFKQSQFILDNNVTTEQVTNVLGKLFEPELFMLHPGDKYVITYTLNEPVGGDPSSPTTLDTDTKYRNYISDDPNNRKLFRLSFYQITASNNLTLMDPSKLNVILAHSPLLDVDYAYFTGNSNAALAAGLSIETLDYFDANVVDGSLRTDENKKIGIEALGSSASLNDFLGVRVDITSPTPQTFYLERKNAIRKVDATVDGFSSNDEVECTVTPYSQYCLFPQLAKSFKVDIGQYLTVGTGINNLFRYYKDPSGFMQVDFDYRFQGNTAEGIHLYVEFYDPWSDYSIVKTVDNPTYYGINSVIMELVNEPIVDEYDSTTVGGTSPSKLITNPDTEFESTLLNSTNQIRTDQSLRENHFYIVRVSGVDKVYDPTSGLFSYKHYDFYKGMYTNDMFNDIYQAQGGLSPTDSGYVGDFNSLDFILEEVAYASDLVLTSTVNSVPVVTTQRDDLTTGGQYYKVSSTATGDTTTPYKYTQTYKTTSNYTLTMTPGGVDNVFGFFKNNLLSIQDPSLQSSSGTDGSKQKPTVTDSGYDGNSLVQPNSVADWILTNISGTTYSLTITLQTDRSLSAPISTTTATANDYKEVNLLPSLYYRPNGDATWATLSGGGTAPTQNPNAGILIMKYDLQVVKEDGTTAVIHLGSGASPNDGGVASAINTYLTSRPYSAVVMYGPEPTWGYGAATPYNNCNDHYPYAAWKQCNMLLRTHDDGLYHLTKSITLESIVDFFTNLFITSNVPGTVNVYYPTPTSISYNSQISTASIYPDMNFAAVLTPTSDGHGGYLKTYLSLYRMHATGALQDFSADNLNAWIAARKGDSTILDGKDTLRDGFIPFVETPQSVPVPVAVGGTTITQAANNVILTAMENGVNEYTSDPAFQAGARLHGTIFTTKPDAYAKYIPLLQSHNVTSSPIVEVGSGAVYVSALQSSALWQGHFAYVGRCKDDNQCPSLMPSFDIS